MPVITVAVGVKQKEDGGGT